MEGLTGILPLDKPAGFTSFDMVAKIRGMAKTRRVGHAGTLDPDATGVLPVFLGGATRFIGLVPHQNKRYTATFRLGIVTDTQDTSGTVLEEHRVDVTPGKVAEVIASFVGEGTQVPPMYSAVKKDGVRLYELARKGVEVERKPRPVTFYEIALLRGKKDHYTIDVHCSKGAYIRTLCHDIGRMLGCGAALEHLRRTEACGFTLGQCHPPDILQALTDAGRLNDAILPTEAVFAELPRAELSEGEANSFLNGIRIAWDGEKDGAHTVYGPEGFLGLAQPQGGCLVHIRTLPRT